MSKRPVCIGAGLVALDVVISGNSSCRSMFLAGGSCGNVLTILSYLGWDSYPVARLSNNVAADILLEDLQRWKVKSDLISVEIDGSTPVIIHRILKGIHGEPKHKFEFKNPEDGKYLPSYKPTLAKSVPSILAKVSGGNVFYFDRINRSAIEMAKSYKQKGLTVFFEPSSIKDINGFLECLHISDIVKFSNDRISNYQDLFPVGQVPLEIRTLGINGLQFRRIGMKSWHEVPSYSIENVVDSAGAGDWCTAGIINVLCNGESINIFEYTDLDFIRALRFGQTLSALNCTYEGARGLMYNVTEDILMAFANKVVFSKSNKISISELVVSDSMQPINDIKISSLLVPV